MLLSLPDDLFESILSYLSIGDGPVALMLSCKSLRDSVLGFTKFDVLREKCKKFRALPGVYACASQHFNLLQRQDSKWFTRGDVNQAVELEERESGMNLSGFGLCGWFGFGHDLINKVILVLKKLDPRCL